jgi:hypothetical protein
VLFSTQAAKFNASLNFTYVYTVPSSGNWKRSSDVGTLGLVSIIHSCNLSVTHFDFRTPGSDSDKSVKDIERTPR